MLPLFRRLLMCRQARGGDYYYFYVVVIPSLVAWQASTWRRSTRRSASTSPPLSSASSSRRPPGHFLDVSWPLPGHFSDGLLFTQKHNPGRTARVDAQAQTVEKQQQQSEVSTGSQEGWVPGMRMREGGLWCEPCCSQQRTRSPRQRRSFAGPAAVGDAVRRLPLRQRERGAWGARLREIAGDCGRLRQRERGAWEEMGGAGGCGRLWEVAATRAKRLGGDRGRLCEVAGGCGRS